MDRTAWQKVLVGDTGDARNVKLGRGRNDGTMRVYTAAGDGNAYEYTWTGTAWQEVSMGNSGATGIKVHAHPVAARPDGLVRTYVASTTGVHEYAWNGSAWSAVLLGDAVAYMYGLDVGDGLNDGTTQVYGSSYDGNVYLFKWVPTGTVAVPNMVGQIESAARTAITTAGLTVGTVTNPGGGGLVTVQSPSAGTSVAPGTAVAFTVNIVTSPVTVTLISVGAEDGWVRESNETSNVGGNLGAAGTGGSAIRAGDETADRQYKGFVSVDTSSIPDGATVTAVTLQLTRGGGSGTNPFTTHGALNVDVQSGAFSGSAALQNSDFQAAATAVAVASMSTVSSNGQVSSGTFSTAGRSAINKTGTTQVRLYFSLDDNDDGVNSYVGFYSGSNSTNNNRPRLVVTYTP